VREARRAAAEAAEADTTRPSATLWPPSDSADEPAAGPAADR